jgi:hypothetical protein
VGTPVSGESAWRRSRVVVRIDPPGAGADWSLTVPAGHIYQLLALHARLVTSAAVATRIARLAFGDGVSPIADLPPQASQAASLTYSYAWLPSPSGILTGTFMLSVLPDLELQAGWTLASLTQALDAADQWDQVRVLVLDTTARRGKLDLNARPDFIVEVLESGPGSGQG